VSWSLSFGQKRLIMEPQFTVSEEGMASWYDAEVGGPNFFPVKLKIVGFGQKSLEMSS
jgi:hypothetical protein